MTLAIFSRPHRVREKAVSAAVAILLCAATSALAQSTPPAFNPREEFAEQFPPGRGRDETFYACTPCHTFKLVAAQGLNRRQWDESLAWMTQRHGMPAIEGKERELILDYLEENFPPRAQRGWQNPFSKQ